MQLRLALLILLVGCTPFPPETKSLSDSIKENTEMHERLIKAYEQSILVATEYAYMKGEEAAMLKVLGRSCESVSDVTNYIAQHFQLKP